MRGKRRLGAFQANFFSEHTLKIVLRSQCGSGVVSLPSLEFGGVTVASLLPELCLSDPRAGSLGVFSAPFFYLLASF